MRKIVILPFLLLVGCSGDESKQAKIGPVATSLSMNKFMGQVMQHAADDVWSKQGYISDNSGSRSLFPQNDEEWTKARNASLLLSELTNGLLIPGRRVAEADWDKSTVAVRKAALQAALAAEKKDEDAFMEAGGQITVACKACHEKYSPGSGV